MTADFDTEVLQWPGGTLIAFFLWLYVKISTFWRDTAVARHGRAFGARGWGNLSLSGGAIVLNACPTRR